MTQGEIEAAHEYIEPAIWAELRCRKGVLEDIEPEVLDEFRQSLSRIIRERLEWVAT